MKKGFFGSMWVLLASTGFLLAQSPVSGQLPSGLALSDPPANPGAAPFQEVAGGAPRFAEWQDVAEGRGDRLWVKGEYLLWWIKDSALPPLVTTSPPAAGGILGPNTTVLYGGSDVDNELRSGGRFTAGFWLDDCHRCGLESTFFFLGSRSVNFTAGSPGTPGSPVLARPFFNVLTNAEDAELVAFPGLLGGTVGTSLSSSLWGIEANGVCEFCCGCNYKLEALGGFRYLELHETLGITENLTIFPQPSTTGATEIVSDRFDARNQFYGGQLGVRGEVYRGRLFANVQGKVALGSNHETVQILGSSVITPTGGGMVSTGNGGLLAQPSNSGRFSRDVFAVVPEVGVNIGYQVTGNLRAFVGYNFLFCSDVVRPGDQIDRRLNPNQLPTTQGTGPLVGPPNPAFSFNSADFWAQGINLGLEFQW